MTKSKSSTFKRLGAARLNRTERRELQRRLSSADPGLEIMNQRDGDRVDSVAGH
jgi:hypothetical protein